MKHILVWLLFAFSFPGFIWGSGGSYPSYYSLKEDTIKTPMVKGSLNDWGRYLPTGDFDSFYASYFNFIPTHTENVVQAYQKALELEEKGRYQEAADVFQKIDEARKSIWEWANVNQIPLLYNVVNTAGSASDRSIDETDPFASRSIQGNWGLTQSAYLPGNRDLAQAIGPKQRLLRQHRRIQRQFQHLSTPPETGNPAFQVRGINLPATGAWEWLRVGKDKTTVSQTRLAFQEAANRIEIYSSDLLKNPKNLSDYLKARQAFTDAKYLECEKILNSISNPPPGLTSQVSDLKFLCKIRKVKSPDDLTDMLKTALAQKLSAKILYNLALAYLGDEWSPEGEASAEKTLWRLVQLYPQSRYADDASYLLAKIGMEENNWSKTQKAFRALAEKFNGDDIVAMGGLASLVSMAKTYFQIPTLEETLWKLANGSGDYDPEKSDLKQIKAVYRPYLMLWRSEHVSEDQRNGLLAQIADLKKDSCIRREGLFLLATRDRLSDELGYRHKDNEMDANVRKYTIRFLEEYPEDPRTIYMLTQTWDYFPDDTKTNVRLMTILKKLSKYHPLPDLQPFSRREKLNLLPFNGEDKFNEKLLVDSGRSTEILKNFPSSPWAFPEFIALCQSTTEGQVKTVLPTIRKYQDWLWAHKTPNPEHADILHIKVGSVEMMASHWQEALDQVTNYFKTGRNNWFLDEALWIKGTCLEKLGKTDQADKAFETLVEKFPEGGEAELFNEDEGFSYGERAPDTVRTDKASPYTFLAYQKVTSAMEKAGQWEKALDIYFKLGYRHDIALVIDYEMPIPDLIKYMQDHAGQPVALPKGASLKYSLAMRYFRENNFDNALSLLPDKSILPTPIPTPVEVWRRYPTREKTELIPDDEFDLRSNIETVKTYYDNIATALTDEAKSYAIYHLGRFFYTKGRYIYYNRPFWKDMWYHDEPLDQKKLTDDSYHLPFLNYRDAGYQFYQIMKFFPHSPIVDRASYDYALCQVKQMDDGYWAPDEPVTETANLFKRVADLFPNSTLADDALFWAAYFDNDNSDKYYGEIINNYQDGDVIKFFPSEVLLKGQTFGVYQSYPNESPFYAHNLILQNPLEPTKKPVLVDFSYTDSNSNEKSTQGWLYYRSPGGTTNFVGTLNMFFQGAEESNVTVNLSGKAIRLPAGKKKLFSIKDENWPPNITKWVYFQIDSMPKNPVIITHNIELQSASETFTTEKEKITFGLPKPKMILTSNAFPIDSLGTNNNYQYTCSTDGKVLWSISQNGTNKKLLILVGEDGKPVPNSPVSVIPTNVIVTSSFMRYRGSDTPNISVKKVHLEEGKKLGFNQDDVNFNIETSSSYLWFQWVGKDSNNRIYIHTTNSDDRTLQGILILDPTGKILAQGDFPVAKLSKDVIVQNTYNGYYRFAFVVLPSGGVQREYFVEGSKPTLEIDKLFFK